MPFVVNPKLHQVQYTYTASRYCPVDLFFHEGPNFLVIDPEECIDCTLVRTEWPCHAIFPKPMCPRDRNTFIQLNAEPSEGLAGLDSHAKIHLPTAKDWDGKADNCRCCCSARQRLPRKFGTRWLHLFILRPDMFRRSVRCSGQTLAQTASTRRRASSVLASPAHPSRRPRPPPSE